MSRFKDQRLKSSSDVHLPPAIGSSTARPPLACGAGPTAGGWCGIEGQRTTDGRRSGAAPTASMPPTAAAASLHLPEAGGAGAVQLQEAGGAAGVHLPPATSSSYPKTSSTDPKISSANCKTSTMPTKGGPKKPTAPRQITKTPVEKYEEVRLRNCMQNSARLRELGIIDKYPYFGNTSVISQGKNNTNQRSEHSSAYDPLQDDDAEGDSISSNGSAKASKKKSCKSTKNQTLDAPSCGVRFQTRKRVCAPEQPTRRTKSKQSNAEPAEPSDLHVPAAEPSELHVPFAAQDDGADAISQSHNLTHMGSEDDGADVIPQSDGHKDNNTIADKVPWNRGVNMGHGLQRINRSRCGKLPIIIPEGSIKPLTPIISAKYATECNITVRNHVPVLLHWKEYKKRPALIEAFLGYLRVKFDIDTDDLTVRKGCVEMMKTAVRQQRHRLKKRFFDPFPLHLVPRTSPMNPPTSNYEWLRLVESWKNPEKMVACQKNKDNWELVQFPGTTGSCSYPVFVEKLAGENEGNELDAFGLFKLTHFSKRKNGYTPMYNRPLLKWRISWLHHQLKVKNQGPQTRL